MKNQFFAFHFWGPCILVSLLLFVGCKKKEAPSAPVPASENVKTEPQKIEPVPSDVISIQGTDQFIDFLKNNPMAIVDFTAVWCGPCQRLAPELDKIAAKYKDQGLKVAKVDIDRNPDIASAFNVQPIPDVRFFSGGKEILKVIGLDIGGIYIGTQDLLNRKGASPDGDLSKKKDPASVPLLPVPSKVQNEEEEPVEAPKTPDVKTPAEAPKTPDVKTPAEAPKTPDVKTPAVKTPAEAPKTPDVKKP